MPIPLRAMILDDHPSDAELIARELRQAQFELSWERLETEGEFIARLAVHPDIVFSVYALPQFNALSALKILRDRNLDIPLIVVTHPVGDEAAAECMKRGAADYLLKAKLKGLGEATSRALQARELRQERRQADEYVRSIIDSSLDMIITTDDERRVVEFNLAAQHTFGYTREEVLGKHIGLLYANWEEGQEVHQLVIREGKVTREILNQRKNGQVFPSLLSASVLRDGRGNVLGVLGVSRDITEQKATEERLRYLSMHDTLTGLYNRAYFEEEMARLQRGRQFPVSVIMADLDGLKTVNDGLGHGAGDQLLRQVAKILLVSFRKDDVVARIGGDEFAVLLPSADAMTAQALVTRLRTNLDVFNESSSGPRLGLSLGSATAERGDQLSDCLTLADQRMYREKKQRQEPQDENVEEAGTA